MKFWSEMLLARRIRAGDREACAAFVRAHHADVYRFLARLCRDAHAAEDLTQETFAAAWQGIGSFGGLASLKTWLYRLAVNQASNHRRWWRRRCKQETVSLDAPQGDTSATLGERLPSGARSPEQVALTRERQRLLMAALDQLKHDYRVAVVLRDIEELSYEEIAATLDVPVGTVKSRIARGREELRNRLQEMGV